MLTRLRHTISLVIEIFRFSVSTRTYWFAPLLLVLLMLMGVASAAEVIVPYAIYPIF